MAAYVKKLNWFTPIYMALITPMLKWIIYPSMMKGVKRRWERASYREYLWVIPFVYGALAFAASMWWVVTGTPFDQLTYEKIVRMPWSEAMRAFDPRAVRLIGALFRELGGNFGILAGVLTMAISANSFRNGERWAWCTLWILPLHSVLDLTTVIGYGALSANSLLWDISLIIITTLSLGLSFRRCFAIVEKGSNGPTDRGKVARKDTV